jgi:hypothetical protein
MPQLIEALSLKPEQREKMDAFLAASRQGAGEGRELFGSFHEALAKGDWKTARSDLEKLAERSAAQTRAGGELKLHVLEALDDQQRALLAEKYPGLLRTQWGSARAQGRAR